MLQFYLSIIFCHMLSCVFDNLLTINVWWWWWWSSSWSKSKFSTYRDIFEILFDVSLP